MLGVYSLLKLFIRQFGGNKMTNNDLQNTTYKTKDCATLPPQKYQRWTQLIRQGLQKELCKAEQDWGQAGAYLKILGFEVQ
jgi:hypothetical protein